VTDFVLSGLVKRRAELAGEAEVIRARLAAIAADLGHLDAVIRQFDPAFDVAAIRPRKVKPVDAVDRWTGARWSAPCWTRCGRRASRCRRRRWRRR
jgi:hypothetical protein